MGELTAEINAGTVAEVIESVRDQITRRKTTKITSKVCVVLRMIASLNKRCVVATVPAVAVLAWN